MAADYLALRAAIDGDAANAGRTDAEVAAALNAPIPGPPRRVPVAEIWSVALRSGRTPYIRRAAAQADHPGRDVAQAALDLFTVGLIESVDPADALYLAVLQGLVDTGLITAETRAAVLALAQTTTTSAGQIAGWGLPATEHDVAHARSL